MNAPLPTLALITTGGTIAGSAPSAVAGSPYQAGQLDAPALLEALPEVRQLAHLLADPLYAIDSKDATPAHWLGLARHVEQWRSRSDCAGVVITHGTDTVEETAFFLDLLLPAGKPVVLTLAMRPPGAHSADGPGNLYQAIAVAADPRSGAYGVLVVADDAILPARWLVKTHTRHRSALAAPGHGPLGDALAGHFHLPPFPPAAPPFQLEDLHGRNDLPAVEVLYVGAGSSPALLAHCQELGVGGVVLALPGNGSVPESWYATIRRCAQAGMLVVQASRVAAGPVSPLPADHPLHGDLYCAGGLSPAKARVALMLALAGKGAADFERLVAARP